MKYGIILIFSVTFLFTSCTKNESEMLDQIQGEWILDQISGGFTGAGTETSWNRVLIEDDSFELLSVPDGFPNSTTIASGNITSGSIEGIDEVFYFNLTETTIDDLGIEIDPEKIITVNGIKMDWNSPCCDRFNYHFSKN